MFLKTVFIFLKFLLILLAFTSNSFAYDYFNRDVLSPALNLEKAEFKNLMLIDRKQLLDNLRTSSMEIENPYEALGPVIWLLRVNDEKLIIRELVMESNDGKEVHNSLLRLLDDGSEEFLGQSWYRFKRGNAILAADVSNLNLPAFKINEPGKGYGSMVFGAVLESAKKYDVDYFSIQIALTSIYERFGFREVEYGILDELYMMLSPDDPSAFNTTVALLKNRGIDKVFISENKTSSAQAVVSLPNIDFALIFEQSI